MNIKVIYMEIWIAHQSFGYVLQNLVADYHLMISSNQEIHIGTNINYLCAIIISLYIMLSFAFSCTELWIILLSSQSRLSYVIKKQTNWPYKQYYVKTSRCFYKKNYHFASNAGRIENANLKEKLRDFRRSSLGDYIPFRS